MSKTPTLDRLKSLRLYGMVAAWTDLIAQGEVMAQRYHL